MAPLKVAICIATYKRPEWLEQLLESLSMLQFGKNQDVIITVIVVDNDRSGSARAVVERYFSHLPTLIYDLEPVQNISLARNKTISIAKESGCDYIAFVDDDEYVEPFWLDELLAALQEYQADMVMGPVIPVFAEPVPDWIIKAGVFERQRYKTGEIIRWGATCNALIKRSFLDQLAGPFDARFGLTGGEDTHLFERLHLIGARMVWSNEAIVKENIPSSRTNLSYILRRAHFGGNTLALTERALGSSKKYLFIRLGKGAGRILQGLVLFLPSLLFGLASGVKSLTYLARGVGMITGILGYKFEVYKRVNGA